MSESLITINPVLDKKLESYVYEHKDFVAPNELTVTITLSEYRDLISKVATREDAIKKADHERWEKENENARLKKQIEELLYKLHTSVEVQVQVND